MIKFYASFRILNTLRSLKEINNNFLGRLIITIILVFTIRQSTGLFILLNALLVLSFLQINPISPLLFALLAIFIPIFVYNIGNDGDEDFLVIDKISNNYVIWDKAFPINLSLFNTFGEIQVYDQISISTKTKEKIDNSYLISLGINQKISGEITYAKKTFLSSITNIKTTLQNNLESQLNNKNSNLIKGFLFGGNGIEDKELKDDLKALGLSHIVSVSGFNFSIIQTSLLLFVRILNRRVVYISSIIFFVTFYLLIGVLNLSAFRAMIMILLASTSLLVGLPVRRINSFLLTILALFVLSPSSIFNISFLLSIFSTLGLTYIDFKETETKHLILSYLFNTLKISTIAFISTLPILAMIFTEVSWGGLISNMIFLPFVPILMFFGFILSLDTQTNFSEFIAFLTNLFSGIFIKLTEILSEIKIFLLDSSTLILITLAAVVIFIYFDYRRWLRDF